MARHGDTEIDRALEVVVREINSLAERQDGGPGVVLTVGGLARATAACSLGRIAPPTFISAMLGCSLPGQPPAPRGSAKSW
jgi:hypothetical protein